MINNLKAKLYDIYGKLSLKIANTFLLEKYNFVLPPVKFLLELNYTKASSNTEISGYEWIKIIRSLPKNLLINPTIILGGRDSIARDDFIDILKEVSKRRDFSLRNNVIVETKGLFLTDEIIESFITCKLDTLIVNKNNDGDNIEENNIIKENLLNLRRYYGQYYNYSKDTKRSKGLHLEVRTEITKNNIDFVLKDYEFLTNLGADKYTIIYNPTIENAVEKEYFNKIRAEIQKMKRYSKTTVEVIIVNGENNCCKYPNLELKISPSGNIFNCLNCKIGNISQNSLKKILKGLEYKEYLKSLLGLRNFGCCKNCIKK